MIFFKITLFAIMVFVLTTSNLHAMHDAKKQITVFLPARNVIEEAFKNSSFDFYQKAYQSNAITMAEDFLNKLYPENNPQPIVKTPCDIFYAILVAANETSEEHFYKVLNQVLKNQKDALGIINKLRQTASSLTSHLTT